MIRRLQNPRLLLQVFLGTNRRLCRRSRDARQALSSLLHAGHDRVSLFKTDKAVLVQVETLEPGAARQFGDVQATILILIKEIEKAAIPRLGRVFARGIFGASHLRHGTNRFRQGQPAITIEIQPGQNGGCLHFIARDFTILIRIKTLELGAQIRSLGMKPES